MSKTTGPVLAMGAITMVNNSIFNGHPIDWRIPVATGLAAIGFDLAERAFPLGAELLAWTALLTVLLTRINPAIPSPAESALKWWDNSGGK